MNSATANTNPASTNAVTECRPSAAPMPWSRRTSGAERPDRDEWDLLLRAAGRMHMRVTPAPQAEPGLD